MNKILRLFKYSGAVVSFTINPFHWRLIPQFKNEEDFSSYNYTFSFMFLTIRLWIDTGEW